MGGRGGWGGEGREGVIYPGRGAAVKRVRVRGLTTEGFWGFAVSY